MDELLISTPTSVRIDDLRINNLKGEWTSRYWSELEGTSCKSIDDVEFDNVCIFGDEDYDWICIVLDNMARYEDGVCTICVSTYIDYIDRPEYCLYDIQLNMLNIELKELCKKIEKEVKE